ncbi:hypothetical protein L210DRAFT_2088780 [Boletus edulis BED1]|uniref:Uncharacterized protein n=1 Tax=Boletus edulis BED1 TaxID=1328754 RepID=A0AAD4GGV2_BOLED|nr:hypothetical protein L210DRAFT_2088780 [Boletus edulis BED1]
MGSTDPTTAILPIALGTAAAFDQSVFPLAYYEEDGGNLGKGSFLIRATLEEMEKIKQLGVDLNKNEDFIFNTRLNIEVSLKARKAKLQENRKTLNPFKSFLNYRAARLFHEGSRSLYLDTKRTSEKIHREEGLMQVVPSTQMRILDGKLQTYHLIYRFNIRALPYLDAVSSDAVIGGISIDLPHGLNDDAKRTINDARRMITGASPFQDNLLISQLRDDEQEITLADTASLLSQDGTGVDEGSRTSAASSDLPWSCPTSPQTINVINVIQNSIVTTNSSNLSGVTQNRGDRSSGASVAQGFVP